MHWPIVLDTKPVIAQMGVGIHGQERMVDTFRLPTLWCAHLYQYNGEVICNGQPFEIRPGHCSVFPPDATLEYRHREWSVHLYAHFSLPAGGSGKVTIPPMQDLGADFTPLNAAFEEAIGWFPTQRLRSEIRLWDILWQLATRTSSARPKHLQPHVDEALRLIELHLGEVIYISDLSSAVGLSQNHLMRLFKAATGKSIAAYIRDRRLRRAEHLLRQSTLPIKAIAAAVGIPDLHLFNKSIRREFGIPPRNLRKRVGL